MSKNKHKQIQISKPEPKPKPKSKPNPKQLRITESRQKTQINNQIPTSKTNICRSKDKKNAPHFREVRFLRLTAGGADAETLAKNNGYTFIAQ